MENILEEKILEYFYKCKKKLTRDEVRKKIGIAGETELAFFNTALNHLEETGKLYLDSRGYYHIYDDTLQAVQGTIYISRRGDGYVRIASHDPEKDMINYMIRNGDLNGALPNDTVVIIPEAKKHHGHQFAIVEKIVKRHPFKEVYKYIDDNLLKLCWVNEDVYIKLHSGDAKGLVKGSLVLATPEKNPLLNEAGWNIFEGTISDVVGHIDDPANRIRAVGLQYGFDNKFSSKIQNIAEKLPIEVTETDLENRVDLRHEVIFTIDGADTKDIDDAVSISQDGDNYILKVHIADVSHYVKDYPALVEEAVERGNSAYLADSVFPMFPHIISNGICSLNEGVSRLAKTVEMTINKQGKIINAQVYKSVIRSRKQMTYDAVNQILNDGLIPLGYESYVADLKMMHKLSKIITTERKSRGSLDLDSREYKITTDIEGKPLSITTRKQQAGENLIENFMILANKTVTEYYGYLDYPFIFRIHEPVEADDLLKVLTVLKEQGIIHDKISDMLMAKAQRIKDNNRGQITSQDIFMLLNSVKETIYYEAVSNVILRIFKKARYSAINLGHFGLSENDYSHFTSPIRRAADLINHIIIDYIMELNNCPDQDRQMVLLDNLEKLQQKLALICEHISEKEVLADKAEQRIEEIEQFQYVIDNADHFDGPLAARILHINKLGARIIVDDLIKANIDNADLFEQGYAYKHESRTFVRKKQCIKFGSAIWVSGLNLSADTLTINYANLALQENELIHTRARQYKRRHKIGQ